MRAIAIVLALSACATDEPRGPTGPDGEFKVVTLDIVFVPGPHDLVGSPCIPVRLVDFDSTMPGLQADCSASMVSEDGTEEILPACTDSTPRCFRLVENASACFEAQKLELQTVLEPAPTAPYHVYLQCVSE